MSLDSLASLSNQKSFYVSMHLHSILYGVELCLYIRAMHVFSARRRERRKSDVFYAAFSTVMFLMITAWVAFMGSFGQATWLRETDSPVRIPYGYIDFVAAVTIILQQMTDSLMMYRCRIVWGNPHVLIVPSILWLATLVLGILVILVSSIPETDFFTGNAAKIGLAYYSTSVFLNVTLTCLICYRLVCHARAVKEHLGDHQASPYYTVMMLLVESVLPFTLSGVAYLVSYGLGSQAEIALANIHTIMTCVSPQMLILRIAEGKSWQNDTSKPSLSVVRFSPGSRDIGTFPTVLGKDGEA